ncbi:NnrU family protein [Hoeflea sp.]|uniref:NnrU family protein n=1 Tax=Hoeflea sp. TaxID=1940281 RepID=UPI003B01AB48
MAEFAIAFIVFLGAHALPARTGLRDALIERLGRRVYLILYSALSLVLLVWLIVAAVNAPHIALWPTSRASVAIALVLTAAAALLLSCGVTRPNPVSISFRGGNSDPQNPGILALTRHPVLWAFFLWSVAHCIANGDVVGLFMFGSFAAFSIASRSRLEKRARLRLGEAGYANAMGINAGPIAERLQRALSPRLAVEAGAGLVLYAIMLALHGDVIGVDPLAYF